MEISRKEIVEYASRYIEDADNKEFVLPEDLFCILYNEIPNSKNTDKESGWTFGGYGICLSYHLDTESKPKGKWVFFEYMSLDTFPPSFRTIKLQPPHIVNGRFSNPSHTIDTKIIPVPLKKKGRGYLGLKPDPWDTENKNSRKKDKKQKGNILQFPQNNK